MKQAGYSGKSLTEKLGIKAGHSKLLVGLPDHLEAELGAGSLYDSKPKRDKQYEYLHLFMSSRATLEEEFPKLRKHLASAGMIWISWPKRAAKVATDLDENIVREIGLANGVVDVKVCAVDNIWSGLKFVIRTKDRG